MKNHDAGNYAKIQAARLSYRKFGRGARLIICFHGYGEDSTSFEFLSSSLGWDESLICFDLPFHGSSGWDLNHHFSDTDLRDTIVDILEEENLPKKGIVILGYSLGGRVGLSLYQLMPECIDRLVLVAPDGLKVNFWYWLATGTKLGNSLFHYTMLRPDWFFAMLRTLRKLGLVNESIFKFVNQNIGDEKIRRELYLRWMSLRKIRPHLNSIRALIRMHKTSVRLIYGRHDRIILPVRGEKFCRGIEEFCELKILPGGHQLLREKFLDELTVAIRS